MFLQAEDGIRAAQESRGLGDVYKRQLYITMSAETFGTNLRATAAISIPNLVRGFLPVIPVSYTHLTLPTIYSV